MKAADHTRTMLAAWSEAGVDRVDLAVRSAEGKMLWQRNRALQDLPMAWLRGANAHGSEIYIRPARGFDWALVFLDDVAIPVAMEAAGRHGGLVVQTSPAGGCHLWLPCPTPLDEDGRCRAQRWLAGQLGADPASVSGEHLGRLAGFRNWKRGGCWVNALAWVRPIKGLRQALDAPPELQGKRGLAPPLASAPAKSGAPGMPGRDLSPSGREWAWVCSRIEMGMDPERVRRELVVMASGRRGEDAERYARRTVARAMAKVGRSQG